MTTLRIGTRKSPLALWQAEHVAALLKKADPALEVELVLDQQFGRSAAWRPRERGKR